MISISLHEDRENNGCWPKKNYRTGGEERYFNATIKIHKSSAMTDWLTDEADIRQLTYVSLFFPLLIALCVCVALLIGFIRKEVEEKYKKNTNNNK